MKKEKYDNKNDINEFKDELTNLIMSQDIIEGYWKVNKETKNLEKN